MTKGWSQGMMLSRHNFCSYNYPVGVYSEDVKDAIFILSEINSGVTNMRFSEDGQILYAGFRKVWSISTHWYV